MFRKSIRLMIPPEFRREGSNGRCNDAVVFGDGGSKKNHKNPTAKITEKAVVICLLPFDLCLLVMVGFRRIGTLAKVLAVPRWNSWTVGLSIGQRRGQEGYSRQR